MMASYTFRVTVNVKMHPDTPPIAYHGQDLKSNMRWLIVHTLVNTHALDAETVHAECLGVDFVPETAK